MADTKDTIYLDVDEEITGIISKVQNSSKNIVALVLPKRASALQSVVNMKLLKRTADQNNKRVVLITSEASLMPLAGAAGVHVASNLNTKPFLPPAPDAKTDSPDDDAEEVTIDPETPVGDLIDEPEAVDIDNTKVSAPGAGVATAKKSKDKKTKKSGKKMKVPNFDSFRKKLLFGGLIGAVLLTGLIWAVFLAPKATVTLKTEASDIAVDFEFTADTSASEVNTEKKVVPASKKEISQQYNEKAPATGSKDKGTKAGGTVTLKNCGSSSATIPAGTGISSGTFTFITQSSISLSDGNFDSGGNCKNSGSHTGTVNVVAQNNGDQYNLSARSYTVSGFSQVQANGSQMSGGSSNVVKVVSAQDVATAKSKIENKKDEYKQKLQDQLKSDGYVPITETFSDNNPTYNTSPAVDSEASEVTVSANVTYSMVGVKEDDLEKLIESQVKDQVDTSKQSILSYGLGEAIYKVNGSKGSVTTINLQTNVSVGPDINQEELKKEIAGKKPGEAEAILSSRPGIIEARVKVTPGWASKVPKKTSKIKFVIENADGKTIDTQQP